MALFIVDGCSVYVNFTEQENRCINTLQLFQNNADLVEPGIFITFIRYNYRINVFKIKLI
jgi:hypothetical protein